MSFNQWKLLNYMRDSINKISNDKSLQNSFKELSQIVDKLPSVLYNTTKINYFQQTGSKPEKSTPTSSGYGNLPTEIEPTKKKAKSEETIRITVPKWKRAPVVLKADTRTRIEDVVQSIKDAVTPQTLLYRIEALIDHIKECPESRSKAINLGAIRLLLQTRTKVFDQDLQDTIREALALFGFCDPVRGRGVRILAIDGGGIRGLLVLEMLKKLEELSGQRVHEMFDYFCGVSTGAILSFSMGIHHRPLDEISHGYEHISKEVFKQSPLWGTGNLVWSHSYYDTALWEKKLKEHLGDASLISTARDPLCPKMCAVSAVVNQSRLSAFLFRNYSLPWRVQSQYLGSSDYEVWQAARASAAAPTYFEEFKLGSLLHQDGGIFVNNPTAIALHEVKLLWPNTPIQCVVSFGTGRTVPTPTDVNKLPEDKISSSTSWTNKFYKILDSATDTEAVHTMLNDLLPDNVYYRFNPYLTEMISMVETDSKKLELLRRDAVMYLRRNEDKFQEAARALTESKTFTQKIKDYAQVQREVYGF